MKVEGVYFLCRRFTLGVVVWLHDFFETLVLIVTKMDGIQSLICFYVKTDRKSKKPKVFHRSQWECYQNGGGLSGVTRDDFVITAFEQSIVF